jgi:hypothetical protein
MVPLTTAASPFEARVLVARLGADGFLWELRGNVDGPYPLGPVSVLVPADQVVEARELLLADEVAEVFEAPAYDGAGARPARDAWIAAALVVLIVCVVLVRVFASAS